jgi:ArsR family transcriptional regulator, arsenate/arsenite/antimonite-responsive transcriptional repressor
MQNNKAKNFNAEQQQLAEIGKIFSHPARIAIVQLLVEKKEIKTGNISDYLPIGRTTVSKHLKNLQEAGIIKGTIDGLKIHYCLDIQKLNEIRNHFNKFLDKTISSFLCNC